MTTDQIHEAMGKMISHCRKLEEGPGYPNVSARGVLATLGYTQEDQDEVIKALHEGGFNYCLDPMFPSNGEPTPAFACAWGPDQLRSRLDWVAPARYR
jgi:hypothetical protein